ncbi:Cyclodextrin-binding protein precursor [Pseudovibrio axinellae]|uniref:Cyclodextrin-binding protein n=1 Tax=Pseudovibrio axinellae TaxID=989403 RepID=A0A165T4W2_9HYPH|nr:sugar ABC transporter substrate-binding protein [Pseudovibrio axinellae]KZL05433.1 Cyclodextrin-binding protein precursor [Pseudovibrio axinellae]SEP99419.1 carbohydrate ABC transporter substrate-binding protein, CUT1 family [Pseudovibrio axinellae]
MRTKLLFAMAAGAAALITASSAQSAELHFIRCGDDGLDADRKVVAAFEAANPGTTVNMESLPWGTCQDKSLKLASTGSPPSVSYMGSRTLKQLADNNLIVDAKISEEQQKAYQPGVLNTVSYREKFWGFPRAFSTKALFLNCDVFEEAGLACEAPKTWDDMYAAAKIIKDKTGKAGVGLTGKDFDSTMHQFLIYLYSNGGQVIDPSTNEITLDSKNTLETLKFYGKLVDVSQDGPTAFERTQVRDLFNDNKVAMYIDGPWGRGQHKEGINTKVAPVPAGPSGVSGTLLITDSLAVFKGSGHEDLAMEFARMMTTGESQYSLDKPEGWGLTPILKYEELGVEKPYYMDDPYWAVFIESIPNGGPEPLFVDYKAMQSVMNTMIQGILLNDDTAENLVAIAAEELEEFK